MVSTIAFASLNALDICIAFMLSFIDQKHDQKPPILVAFWKEMGPRISGKSAVGEISFHFTRLNAVWEHVWCFNWFVFLLFPLFGRSNSTSGPSRKSKRCWRMQQLWMWNAPRKTPTKKNMEKQLEGLVVEKWYLGSIPQDAFSSKIHQGFLASLESQVPKPQFRLQLVTGPILGEIRFFLVNFERPAGTLFVVNLFFSKVWLWRISALKPFEVLEYGDFLSTPPTGCNLWQRSRFSLRSPRAKWKESRWWRASKASKYMFMLYDVYIYIYNIRNPKTTSFFEMDVWWNNHFPRHPTEAIHQKMTSVTFVVTWVVTFVGPSKGCQMVLRGVNSPSLKVYLAPLPRCWVTHVFNILH